MKRTRLIESHEEQNVPSKPARTQRSSAAQRLAAGEEQKVVSAGSFTGKLIYTTYPGMADRDLRQIRRYFVGIVQIAYVRQRTSGEFECYVSSVPGTYGEVLANETMLHDFIIGRLTTSK